MSLFQCNQREPWDKFSTDYDNLNVDEFDSNTAVNLVTVRMLQFCNWEFSSKMAKTLNQCFLQYQNNSFLALSVIL